MTDTTTSLADTLKTHGFSLTQTRTLVFKALQDNEPQTMYELVTACPGIDRASVYRTIGLFESLGIAQRLQIGWKYKLELTDSFIHHHHHLSCSNCGKLIALPENPKLEAALRSLATSHSFTAQDHQLEIRGLCGDCQSGQNVNP